MGWLVTVGILILLAVLPLGVSVRYDHQGPLVRVVAGPVKIKVFPLPKKAKQEKKPKTTENPPEVKETAEQPHPQPPQPPRQENKAEQEKGGSLLDFLPLVKLAFRFLGDFRRKLRIDELQLKLTLAGGDPCDLAVNYGKTWAAVGNLLPRLDSWFVIKKRDVQVQCDFAGAETLVVAHLELTITLGRLISLAVVYAIRALKEFINLKNKRKGGAVT